MCPCDLRREYVCTSCAAGIEAIYKLLTVAEEKSWDSQRFWRGKLDGYGLAGNIVIYKLTNGARQSA